MAPRNSRLLVLSNNHVFARSNDAALGQSIVQPGQGDGGVHPADQIAILERFVLINFASGAINFVHRASVRRGRTATSAADVLSGRHADFLRVRHDPGCAGGQMVNGKTGRTTQLPQGRATAVSVSVNVIINEPVAHFRDQISIVGTEWF